MSGDIGNVSDQALVPAPNVVDPEDFQRGFQESGQPGKRPRHSRIQLNGATLGSQLCRSEPVVHPRVVIQEFRTRLDPCSLQPVQGLPNKGQTDRGDDGPASL